MGKKGLASIFSRLVDSSPAAGPTTPPWPWPPCGTNPPTASFRSGVACEEYEPCCTTAAAAAGASRPAASAGNKLAAPGEMYKTVNSVYLDDPAADVDLFSLAGDDEVEEEGEVLDLDDVDSFSTTTASEEWSEAVIRSLGRTSTDRFFFDPGPLPASNSILATAAPEPELKALPPVEAKATAAAATKAVTVPDPDDEDGDAKTRQPCTSVAEGSVAVAVDSGDPYGDFRASMEEMVAAHGLRDWAALEELLACYLRINGKQHHHLIVGAFVDLLLGLASSDTTAGETSTSSSSSSSGSACAGSRCCTTSSSTSTAATTTTTSVVAACDAAAAASATATTASTPEEQCGGGNEEAAGCCSSSSSSCAAGPDVHDDVADEEGEAKASGAATGDDRACAAASAPLRVPQSIA